jgi:subtilisin family serine protease
MFRFARRLQTLSDPRRSRSGRSRRALSRPTLEALEARDCPSASLQVVDASGDDTPSTVFRGGAIRVTPHFEGFTAAAAAEAVEANLNGVWTPIARRVLNPPGIEYDGLLQKPSLDDPILVNLANVSNLDAGVCQIRAKAELVNGKTFCTPLVPVQVLTGRTVLGSYRGTTYTFGPLDGTGAVLVGRGGTDTLVLPNVAAADIADINGMTFTQFVATPSSVAQQAIYRGSAFDYLHLKDGREVYFQGMERLRLGNGQEYELAVHPNNPQFAEQWNLQVMGVPDAWRFTTGTSKVLLVSLDSGVLDKATLTAIGLDSNRLTFDKAKDVDEDNHGHKSISIMISTPNTGPEITGLNWGSQVLVENVNGYSVTLYDAIKAGIEQVTKSHNYQRVVFQGGIQGEQWLTSGCSTQDQLQALINDNADVALFAIAAGNGGRDMQETKPIPILDENGQVVLDGSTAGVARLAPSCPNLISVGALEHTEEPVAGLANAASVYRASDSNFGAALTLMAPTDSPAIDVNGNLVTFAGTSCANPNLAGVASLVWSANPSLHGDELKQFLIDTAMRLGSSGHSDYYGYGLVDASAAVRRAAALARDPEVALLIPMGTAEVDAFPIGSNGFVSPRAWFLPPRQLELAPWFRQPDPGPVFQGLRSPLLSSYPLVELVSAVPEVHLLASGSHVASPVPALADMHLSTGPSAFSDKVLGLGPSRPGSGQPAHAARSLTGQHQQPNLSALDDTFAALAAGHLFQAGGRGH